MSECSDNCKEWQNVDCRTLKEHNLRKILGSTLRDLRKKKKFSQQVLADLSEMDRTYLSDLERGKWHPNILWLFKVCETLDIKPQEFIALIDKQLKK